MNNVIKTAGVLVIQNRKVLLIRHGEMAQHLNDVYGIPAGRIQPNESLVDAAIREFTEETGLTTSSKYLIKIPTVYTAKIRRKNGIKTFSLEAFLCKKYEGELKSTDEAVPEWINIEDLEKLKLLPNVKEVIAEALELK